MHQSLAASTVLLISLLLTCGLAVDEKDNCAAVDATPKSIPSYTGSVHRLLALQRLLEYMQRVVHFRVLGTFAGDLAHRVQYGRVIAASK